MPDDNDNSSFDSVKSEDHLDLDNYYNIDDNERNDTKKKEDAPRASEELFMTTRSRDTKMNFHRKINSNHTRTASTGIQTSPPNFKINHHSSQT